MNNYGLLVVCVAVILAGCPVDTTEKSHDLTLSILDEDATGEYEATYSVNLGGEPPSDITYSGVKVSLLNGSTEMAEHHIGNVTIERYTVEFNVSVNSRPDKILIKFDKVTGEDQPGNVQGSMWDPDLGAYVEYNSYTPQY